MGESFIILNGTRRTNLMEETPKIYRRRQKQEGRENTVKGYNKDKIMITLLFLQERIDGPGRT